MSYASSEAWNTTLSSYWFTRAAQRFMSEHLSPPLRHHSQSGDIWHALAISMDLNPTGFQLTWRNPILYGAPHCITLHTFPSDTAALRTVTGHMGNKHCFSHFVTNGAVCTVRSRWKCPIWVNVVSYILYYSPDWRCTSTQSLKTDHMYVIHPKWDQKWKVTGKKNYILII